MMNSIAKFSIATEHQYNTDILRASKDI